MSASFKVDLSGLKNLVARLDSPTLRNEILRIPQKKAVAAIVAEAIADNFNHEGPGWAPLKAQTIRSSVSKRLKKKLRDMTDKQILKHEKAARKPGSELVPSRSILQRTGLLKKSATTPGIAQNIYKVEGSKLIWGSNLAYAQIHNRGGTIKNGFGKGIKIKIPKREFLVIRDKWKKELYSYVASEYMKIIRATLKKGS